MNNIFLILARICRFFTQDILELKAERAEARSLKYA